MRQKSPSRSKHNTNKAAYQRGKARKLAGSQMGYKDVQVIDTTGSVLNPRHTIQLSQDAGDEYSPRRTSSARMIKETGFQSNFTAARGKSKLASIS